MSNSFTRTAGRGVAAVALALAVGACTVTGPNAGPYGTPVRAAGTVPYVHPQAEPQSCKSLRRYDEQLAQQRARGNSRVVTGIISGVTGALLGNESTRDAGIGAAGGAVVGEVYTSYQQRQARTQLANQCNADIQALQRGVCTWNANTNETTRTVGGRPAGVFQGDARRSQACLGTGGPVDDYRPPIQ